MRSKRQRARERDGNNLARVLFAGGAGECRITPLPDGDRFVVEAEEDEIGNFECVVVVEKDALLEAASRLLELEVLIANAIPARRFLRPGPGSRSDGSKKKKAP